MLPQIKLTVTQNDKLIQTVTKTVEKQHLIKSLEEFQLEANAALTKMIEELGEVGDSSKFCVFLFSWILQGSAENQWWKICNPCCIFY